MLHFGFERKTPIAGFILKNKHFLYLINLILEWLKFLNIVEDMLISPKI
jgi:hypothetical protein